MAGLLDFNDPDSAGMMGIAQGLLSASGPSRMPVSFGQALGAASQQGQQQYQSAQASRRQDLAYQLQMLQLQQQLRQQALLEPIYKQIGAQFGGSQAPQIASTAPTAAGLSPSSAAAFGAPQMATPDAPAPQVATPQANNSIGGIPSSNAGLVLALGGPAKLAEAITSYNAPTDFVKTLSAAGIDPSSTLGKQLIQAQLAKQNYIAPTSLRPGGYAQYADGRTEQMPHVPDGYQAIKGADNQWHIVPVDGGVGAITASAAAAAAGKNAVEPIAGFIGNQPVFTNKFSAATGGGAPNVAWNAPGSPTWNGKPMMKQGDMKGQIGNIPDGLTPQENAGFGNVGVTPAPALGAEKGATLGQEELSKKWSDLNANNQQAQPTISYLQSIKQQAEKAATGPMSDKVQFANGLLAFAGVSDKALDATTANNLLDKYSNQIVARLGTGGLGTDAARSILQAAYPNAHMTKEAINEAADNLIGAQQMLQAKAKILSPAAAKRDPAAYQQAEVAFDQNADPRIWQLQGMNPQQQAQYVKSLPANVAAQLLKQRQALKQLGAL